jgi:hypothetical protein
MEQIGHSHFATTMDIGFHVMPSVMQDAADEINSSVKPPRGSHVMSAL